MKEFKDYGVFYFSGIVIRKQVEHLQTVTSTTSGIRYLLHSDKIATILQYLKPRELKKVKEYIKNDSGCIVNAGIYLRNGKLHWDF